jgi:hypothetical protein
MFASIRFPALEANRFVGQNIFSKEATNQSGNKLPCAAWIDACLRMVN